MNTSRKLDLWLIVTGIGSWVLFVASLALSGFWAAYVFPRMPESLANWLFWGSAVAALVCSALLAGRIRQVQIPVLPLMAGFGGATLLSACLLLAAMKWLQG
jgi:hypothetical protein